jgi:beta-xylosidase
MKRSVLGLLLVGVLAGCSGGGNASGGTPSGGTPSTGSSSASGGSTPSASSSAGSSPSASATSAPPSPAEGEFVNPVLASDFPDPFILHEGDTYYAYATGFRISQSPDLVEWGPTASVVLQTGWATRDFWAPEVAKTSAGFVMYYTGRSLLQRPSGDTAQCVGRAVSATPDGKFVDESQEPLVCQPDLGGTIDATAFVDEDGKRYLVYKNDGNCCAIKTRFWIAPLSDDGLTVTAEGKDMGVSNDERWEGAVIEAPTLVFMDGTYYLFYSANDYGSANYAVGYATSEALLGPYVDAEENPILHSNFEDLMADPEATVAGPGHQSVVADDDGDLWMTYHAWDRAHIGYQMGGRRTMWIDELVFEDGKPVIKGPDAAPQPVP